MLKDPRFIIAVTTIIVAVLAYIHNKLTEPEC